MSKPTILDHIVTVAKNVFGIRDKDTASPADPEPGTRAGSAADSNADADGTGAPATTTAPGTTEEATAAHPEIHEELVSEEERPHIANELSEADTITVVAEEDSELAAAQGAAVAASAPDPSTLAVPGYPEASLPSVRARLRNLTLEQVRQLRAYEVAHENRTNFVRMFDNRIAKLEGGDA